MQLIGHRLLGLSAAAERQAARGEMYALQPIANFGKELPARPCGLIYVKRRPRRRRNVV
jgi:hypothetical protein